MQSERLNRFREHRDAGDAGGRGGNGYYNKGGDEDIMHSWGIPEDSPHRSDDVGKNAKPPSEILRMEVAVRSKHPCIKAKAPPTTHQKSACIPAQSAGGTGATQKA